MKASPKARPVRWIVALAFVGALSAPVVVARAGEDQPYPSPVTTLGTSETLGVMVHGAAMGMTAVW